MNFFLLSPSGVFASNVFVVGSVVHVLKCRNTICMEHAITFVVQLLVLSIGILEIRIESNSCSKATNTR